MLPLLNGIVLDVIVIAALLSVIFLGAFKGIKHISINFVLFMVSLAVSLMSFTNVLKVALVEFISPYIKLNVSVALEHKLALYMLYMFFASIVLTILLYVILRLIKLLICFLVKKRMQKNNELYNSVPTPASRIAGGLFSLVFNGLLIIFALSIFSTPLVGGDKTSEVSYVSKHIEKVTDTILELVSDDQLLKDKIIVKLVKSDVLLKVSDEDAKDFQLMALAISKKEVIPANLDKPQESVNKLGSLVSFVSKYMLDEKGVELDGYELVVETTRDLANKSVTTFNSLRDSGPLINAEGTLAIANNLESLGLDSTVIIFEEAFEQR